VILYFGGTFDTFLYQFGLNRHICAQNLFGTVICGDDLKQFCRENYDRRNNGEACDRALDK
jgi:hypothetical protein